MKIVMRYLGQDSWGRHTYEADNHTIWKFTDLKPRELCEKYDRLHSASCFDGEPDCYISQGIEVEYIPESKLTLHAEYVKHLGWYRLYQEDRYGSTVAYVDSPDEARERGYNVIED